MACRYYQEVMGLSAAEMAPVSVVEQAQLLMPVRRRCQDGLSISRSFGCITEAGVASSLEHGPDANYLSDYLVAPLTHQRGLLKLLVWLGELTAKERHAPC